jgi:2-polyprenyl-3-methyl-5-hydroxy-6-metoxy-1,4-benzoquinol methylase
VADAAYSRVHRHVLSAELPPLLEQRLDEINSPLVDVGCGDGWLLHALARRNHLPAEVAAVDLSPERAARAGLIAPSITGVIGDAAAVPLPDASCETLLCSQVIEHLADDSALAPEIARLLRRGGSWYVSSICRDRTAWWIYRRDGRWWLDPTHVREYPTPAAFLAVLEHAEHEPVMSLTSRLRFPIADLAVRGLAAIRLLRFEQISEVLTDRPAIRRLRVRVPGYWLVEAWGRRR